ncbi:MAG TPA: polysaccharide deacetylase family protein [Terriglobia bacterium]|nr:polysaccharide deacetylase family protein [Terriglobia bacterium]
MDSVLQPVTCSVIIPTRERPGPLRVTLDSLSQQTEQGFEVIVVVDGEDPQSRSLANSYKATFPLRWIFFPEHKGQATARNTGAGSAESEILIFLDDDTRPVPDWIHHHLKHHRANISRSALGVLGKVADLHANPPRSHTEQYLRESRNPVLAHFEGCLKNQSLEFGKVAAFGLNTSIPRKLFFDVGGFDPKLSSLDEDTDFGARLYDYGARFTFEPEALVHHHETKDPVAQHYAILRAAGKLDVYRRREKKQCNGRLQLLAQMHCGSPLRKLAHRTAWHAPWLFQLAGSLAHKATDASGSKRCFRLWYRATAAEYWQGLRAAGETVNSLRDLYPSRTPILMLHSVSAPTELHLKSLYISPERFTRFMEWLKSAGYASALPVDWDKRPANNRRVILTFDDAYDDFMTNAFPVLERLGFTATVFVVVDRIGKTNDWDEARGFKSRRLLSLDQIRELHRHGVHFGSHTLTHPWLTGAADHDLEREVRDSKLKLEDLLGAEVSSFAYPWGVADMRVRSAVARAGYKVAMTTQEGLNWSEDPLALKRTNVAEVDTLPEFVFKLATGRDLRQMTKAFLVRKGLYRAPEHAGQGGHRGGRDSDESTSEGPARVVIPPAPGPGQ